MSRWLAVIALCAVAACKSESKQEQPPEQPNLQIGEVEADRGRKACTAYKQQVCACAERTDDAEIDRECRLADARIGALNTHIRVLSSPGDMTRRDRSVVLSEVRKVIKGCFEDSVELTKKCPDQPEPPPTE